MQVCICMFHVSSAHICFTSPQPNEMVVLDVGTGPFALLAIAAAKAGAKKVYAVEATPEVAELARNEIRKQGIPDGVIEVLEVALHLLCGPLCCPTAFICPSFFLLPWVGYFGKLPFKRFSMPREPWYIRQENGLAGPRA